MCFQITGRTAGREPSYRTKTIQRHFCKIKCCEPCSYCPRAFAKERNKSRGSRLSSFSKSHTVKYVKGVSCVTQLSYVQPVTNVRNVVTTYPVGARFQHFWKVWLELGAGPKVTHILKEGYPLPFRIRPRLTRYPTVVSCYVNPHRDSYLMEALHQLIDKNAVELVQNQKSLGFFNRLFLVPKPNNRWRPILDLSKLNLFLKVEKFKMETPETIRSSLQQGEWVTSIDFQDAYFHIPIQEQSRKYLRFHFHCVNTSYLPDDSYSPVPAGPAKRKKKTSRVSPPAGPAHYNPLARWPSSCLTRQRDVTS